MCGLAADVSGWCVHMDSSLCGAPYKPGVITAPPRLHWPWETLFTVCLASALWDVQAVQTRKAQERLRREFAEAKDHIEGENQVQGPFSMMSMMWHVCPPEAVCCVFSFRYQQAMSAVAMHSCDDSRL